MHPSRFNAPAFGYSVDCVHAGTVTLEHVRGMLHDECMTASMKRMRGLQPIQMRLLQLMAPPDDKGRRKGKDQRIAFGSAGPRSKAELVPVQSATSLTVGSLQSAQKCMCACPTCPQTPHESSHSARFFCVQHGQSNTFTMLCGTLSNGGRCSQRGCMN